MLLGPGRAHIQHVAQTASVEEAAGWLAFVPGVEGVVVKRSDSRYAPWQGEWIKVKWQRTVGVEDEPTLATPWADGRLSGHAASEDGR